jgi:CHAT domain-containing protein/tetratricopeptide (TPR) repeat protein
MAPVLLAILILAADPTIPVPLTAGQIVEGELGDDQRRSYDIRLEKGQYVEIAVTQKGVDVIVGVRDAAGRLLFERDSPRGAYGTDRARLIAATSGVHRITLRVLDPQAVRGRYLIRVEEPRAAGPADRKRLAAQAEAIEGMRLDDERTSASLARAESRIELAASMWKALGDRDEEALALYELAGIARRRGDNRKNLERYAAALEASRAAGDRQLEARLLDGIALAKIFTGDPAAASDLLAQSIALARGAGDPQTENEALNTLGWSETLLGRYQKAIDLYRRAIALGQSRGDRRSEAWPTVGLAFAYLRLGETTKALATYERALSLWESLGDRNGQVVTLEDMGFLYWSAGDARRALGLFERALTIARDIGNGRGEALALNDIGLARGSLGEPAAARERLTEALAIWRRLADRPGEIQTLHNLGRLEAEAARPESALSLWREELRLARASADPAGEARALAGVARQEAQLGQLDAARSDAEQAVAILEAQRGALAERDLRSSFLSSHQDAFDVLVEVLLRQNESHPARALAESAFSASERGRARSFLEALERAAPAGAAPGGTPALSGAGAPPESVAARIRDRLPPDGALVSFWLGSDRPVAFVVTRGGVEVAPLRATAAQLSERVGVFVDLIARGSASAADAVGGRLYSELVAPWRGRLPRNVRRLVLVADRSLHSMPFEALRAPGGRTLLEDYVVSYAPSGSVFAALRPRPAGRGGAAAVLAIAETSGSRRGALESVAAFDGERFELEPLPFSLREARGAASFGGAGSRVLAGTDLTEARFAEAGLERYRVIHFATHGLLSLRYPERSALLLSPRDGGRLLEARRIYGLKLASDLVVLSACQTARGKVLPGEGVEGLARAFLQSGARTVVASLWNVNDERSAELMAAFYGRLARGEGKAEALRSARLELRRRHPGLPPRVWAPYVLIGEPDGTIPLRLPSLWTRLFGGDE